MNYFKLERRLRIIFLTSKLSLAVILFGLLVLLIIYTKKYFNSKQIEVIDIGFLKHENITYNHKYLKISLNILLYIFLVLFLLLFSLLILRFKTFDLYNYNITIVNYIFVQVIYLEGVKYSSKFIWIFNFNPHTVKLPNGKYCYFEKPRLPFKLTRVYFSDDSSPLEI